jgi:ABC-type polysaccharide/polyol phosphate export permease
VIPFAAMSATSEAPAAFHNAAGSPGPLALIREGIGDIRSRRRLVRYLVQADMRRRGADTVLGNFWWVLDPLLQMVVYAIFITIVARGHGIEDYPLFIFAAILPWKWFSASVIDATGSVVSQERLIKQIQFPKLVLPVAATTAGVVGFAFGLIPLGMLMLIYSDRLTPYILLIPVIAVVQYVFTLAMAILVSGANVFFRDLRNVAGHVLRLWWFLSPGLYSLAFLDSLKIVEQYPIIKVIATANPFAILFTAYRQVIYGSETAPPGPPDWASLAVLGVGSIVFLGVATVIFKRLEPNFAKVL